MVLNARAIFYLFVFFCWNKFSHTKKLTIRLLFATAISVRPPPSPNSTRVSHVFAVKGVMEMKKQTKTKIGVGSIVKAKVVELEKIIR